mgnify:FL=1
MNHTIHYHGHLVRFSDTGSGDALVLLHGFLESLEIWNDFIAKLSSSFRVICIDLPGHGGSKCIGEEHSMDMMADVVKNILDGLSIRKAVIAGHSMGGYVAVNFAHRYPETLSGLLLFHSHASADSEETARNRDRTIRAVEGDHIEFTRAMIPQLFAEENIPVFKHRIVELQKRASGMTKEGIIAALRGMKNRPDRTGTLRKSKVPVGFIIGKKDPRIPLDMIMNQVTLPRHSEMLLLDDTGHMGFIESPDITLKFLHHFATVSSRQPQ